MTRRAKTLAISLSLVLVAPVVASAAEPSSDEPADLTVALRGPFGTVVGTDPADPATAAPDDRPLDTWMRQATLELIVDPVLGDSDTVRFSTTADRDGPSVALPLEDGRWVAAPDEAGLYTVVVTLERDGLEPSHRAWLLEVPDRPGSWETLLERPAIEGRLAAASGSVEGVRGHGCLVDVCQEVGYRPPLGTLEPLMLAAGEPLRLVLGDGSAIVHWEGRLEPQPGTSAETRLAKATFDAPVAGPTLTGLEPDGPGDWLLELRADYDRERGWQWYLFRLIAE